MRERERVREREVQKADKWYKGGKSETKISPFYMAMMMVKEQGKTQKT